MKSHLHWLDLARFIAALAVVITHATSLFLPEFENLPIEQRNIFTHMIFIALKQGHMAVLCFFILSGFFVGGRCIEKIIDKTMSIKSYCIDRFVRIMLPLIPSIILVFIVNNYLGKEVSLLCYLGNLFSLQGILCNPVTGPFWSLSYEVWSYVFMFGIALLCLSPLNKVNKIKIRGG
jgi:peptidoglycan/LPS O-acetylase OafA/YrhL